MGFKLVSDKITEQYSKKLPFVIYLKAKSNSLKALLQNDDKLYKVKELDSPGFVFAPFNYQGTSYFIPENYSEIIENKINKILIESSPVSLTNTEDEEKYYLQTLEKTLETIKKGKATKIVISRAKDLRLHKFTIEKLIQCLFSLYPTAFRYIWYHPKTGLWCGATPETLVQIDNNSFKTMALAGTQPYTKAGTVTWGAKEIDEQQQVTDSIVHKLKFTTSSLKVSKVYTDSAGSLLHLRTDISGELNGETSLTKIVEALHPTPAVCGNPQQFTQDFIIKNEGYPREFYTGFLGSIGKNGTSALFMVNLRCMKIEDNKARIFVGGGITRDSIPKAEWEETQNKMQTMLQVLKPML